MHRKECLYFLARIRYYYIRGGGDREAKPPRNVMNYFVFLKEQRERKKLKKQAQVQENIEITFMSAWFVMGVFLVSLIIYSMES